MIKYCNSYGLVYLLSDLCNPDDVIVTDVGFSFQCVSQAWRVKIGQRILMNCGLAPMGWGLPAAIGAAAGSGRRVVCIAGDGGLMMNIQELATLAHSGLPVKLFVLNNGGYLTMRQSQANAFEGYMGSDEVSGLSFPNFKMIAFAHGIRYWRFDDLNGARAGLDAALAGPGPAFVEVMMDPAQDQIPKSVNKRDAEGNIVQTAIEDAWPYLDRTEIEENMRVE